MLLPNAETTTKPKLPNARNVQPPNWYFTHQATLDGLDGDGWNGWHGKAYVYDEYYHPTAWLGREAVSFIRGYDGTPEGKAGKPYFLKVSFHRLVILGFGI